MNLGSIRSRVKLQVPNFNQTGLTDPDLNNLINEGCNEVNFYCKFYRGYTEFNVIAEQRIYNLSENITDYLGTDKRKLYFKDSNDNWQDVIPKTEAWIAKIYPDYLNATSVALPEWYHIDGDELGFYPPPSTSKTNGIRLYHLKKANAMSSDDHYPYSGTDTEITAFSPAYDAIIAYCKWKLSPAFGANTDQDLRYQEFLIECRRASQQIRRRLDLKNETSYRMGR